MRAYFVSLIVTCVLLLLHVISNGSVGHGSDVVRSVCKWNISYRVVGVEMSSCWSRETLCIWAVRFLLRIYNCKP